jgi:4-amino-4-deoxy-L-arabinose transferase-like glycosyltransferase
MHARRSREPAGESFVSGHGGDFTAAAALLLLSSVAFAHLMMLPAFEDEGSQLRLIRRVIEAGEWLQPLSDGKLLEAWLMLPLVRLHFQPPLAAIRALHVLAGMVGAVSTYYLALRVSNRWTALASGLLFATCPFVVYLQRLALSDIFLCTAAIWVSLGVISLVRFPTYKHALVLALALVLTAFCKFPVGFILCISLPLALLLMPASERRSLLRQPQLAKLLAAYAPAVALALTVVVVLIIQWRRGQPLGFGVKDLIGISMGTYPGIAETIGVPRPGLLRELTAQLSWPVTVLWLMGLAASAFSNDWRQRWLIATGALPLLGIGLFAHFWFSRYLLFALPPLIVSSACGWRTLSLYARGFRQLVELGVLTLSLGLMARQSALIIVDPVSARWSPLDRFQYIEGWGSGYGYPEAAQFVLSATNAPAMIYSLDGHSAEQLRTYLPAEWSARVSPVFYGPNGKALRNETARLENLLSNAPAWIIIPEQLLPVYMASSFGATASDHINVREIAKFPKPGLRTQVAIYEVTRR